MRQITKAIAFLAALLPSLAAAQTQLPTLPANTVLGRLGVSSGPAQAIPFSTLGPSLITSNLLVTAPLSISGLNLQITGSAGKVLGGAGATFIATPTLGVPSTTTGSLTFANSGNTGTVTIQPASTATTWSLTLPTTAGTSGQVLTTNGSGVASWSATGAGNVLGPGSSSNGAITLWNGTGGTTLQNGPLGTTTTVLHGNAAGAPAYGAVALTTDVSGALPVANGGTALTAGTSGGVLGFTASGTIASSVLLTANQIMLGGGAGATPIPLGSLGTANTLLHGNAGGAPTFSAVSLTADVSGTLPFGNGGFGIATATSGGIPYFSSTSSVASSSLLTANAIMLGGGAGAAPATPVGLGTTTTLLHGNAAGTPSFGAVALTTDVAGQLPVANGGTALSSGTSGGVLGFTGSGTVASSVALTASQIVLGGGAGATPVPLGSLGTATTVLHGNAGGAPTFGAVSLTSDITGTLPIASGGTGQTTAPAARSSSGLNIDQVTTFGNANYTSLASDRIIATSSGFTAQRTVTLLPIASYNPGQTLVVIDSAGAINGANTMVIAAAGGETINGSASITVTAQYGGATLWPIASGKWGYIAATAGGGSGTVTSVAAGGGLSTGAGSSTISTSGTLYPIFMPQGRLTLQTSTPVMTTTQSAKGTLFYDCYVGNVVPYYNGTADLTDTISSCEVSTVMVSAASAGQVVSGQTYDAWWVHSGANRICLAMSASGGGGGGWASDTAGGANTRGTGYSQLDTTSRPYITNKNAITNCFNGSTNYGSISANQATYLGTIYASANGQTTHDFGTIGSGTTGTAASFYVWNSYNRRPMATTIGDGSASYAYTTAAWRQAHASTTMQISYVVGMSEDAVAAKFNHVANGNGSVNLGIAVSIAAGTTASTTPIGGMVHTNFSNSISGTQAGTAYYSGFPGLGIRTIAGIEYGGTASAFVPAPSSSPITNNALDINVFN